ncbi:hypothetical protein HZU67_01252 [Apis mellifera carnica]|nr:hypothetical protein HZU67_01252 [Apis mellifera carnica]
MKGKEKELRIGEITYPRGVFISRSLTGSFLGTRSTGRDTFTTRDFITRDTAHQNRKQGHDRPTDRPNPIRPPIPGTTRTLRVRDRQSVPGSTDAQPRDLHGGGGAGAAADAGAGAGAAVGAGGGGGGGGGAAAAAALGGGDDADGGGGGGGGGGDGGGSTTGGGGGWSGT